MSTPRKVACPYCTFKAPKDKMIVHIEKKHPELIPEGYTAARVLFNFLNHKDHGVCVVCKRPTKWNERTNKYDRLCGRPECKKALRDSYKKNMIKVYGKVTLLNDAEQQKKMLANRHISGEYTFKNGTKREYTGSYEKKLLEFLDKVLDFPPDDIITPGPTFFYEFEGKKHQWITDALIVPYNLVIEVKDGGSNPNKRSMPIYRAKQVAKEKMITNMGTYNYIRLTNNNFAQLLAIMYELKMQMLSDNEENKKVIININEETERIKEMAMLKNKIKCPFCEYSTFDSVFMENHIEHDHPYNIHNVQVEEQINPAPNSHSKKVFFKMNEDILCSFVIDTKYNCITETAYNDRYGYPVLDFAIDYAVENLGVNYVLAESKLAQRVYKKKKFNTLDPKSGKKILKYNGKKGKAKPLGVKDIIKTESVNDIYKEMGLAAVGGPIGINSTPFIVQYNNLASPTFKSEYGLQDDIKTDNLVIRDKDGVLKKVPHSFLKDKKYKVFKYKGKEKVFKKVLPKLGKPVPENFIYKACTSVPLVSDNQLLLDENFEYINLPAIKQSIYNDAYTLLAKMQCKVSKSGMPVGRIVSENESVEVKYILSNRDPNLILMENNEGYYVINRKTLRRTNYFKKLSDVVITEDLSR